jgi:ferric-dicitrate binding protein FerR (iron transport regulator)
MLWKQFASATLCACLLLAFAPSRSLAQTQSQPKAAAGERRALTDPRAEASPSLKALFAERASKIGAGGLTEADFRRFEQQQQQANTPPPPKHWSKRKEAVVAILIVAAAAAVLWAVLPHNKDTSPDCANDPSNTLCS